MEMGNNLCKKRMENADDPKNPIDRAIGRCAQMCPKAIGRKKHFWEKQVLETQPPPLHTSQPKSETDNGWKNTPLSVPVNEASERPIAPPRKKRPSMLRKDDQSNKDGFKAVFCKTETKSIKTDKVTAVEKENDESTSDNESDSSNHKASVGVKRNVSKVGNKKSDKFFGENLSDCLSDVPIVEPGNDSPIKKLEAEDDELKKIDKTSGKEENIQIETKVNEEKDDLQKFIENEANAKTIIEKIEDSDELAASIRKEQGNLIFALSHEFNKSEDEPDRKPVEEVVIVPQKRKTRHICDDNKELAPHLHKHSHEETEPIPPKKPQRDFERYRKSMENINISDENSVDNQETLPTSVTPKVQNSTKPKEVPKRNKRRVSFSDEQSSDSSELSQDGHKIESVNTLTPTPESQLETTTVESIEAPFPSTANDVSLSPISPNSSAQILNSPQQELLTPDLIRRISDSLALSHFYIPEPSSDDGSDLVTPQSKLDNKKFVHNNRTTPVNSFEQSTHVDNEREESEISKEKLTVEIKESASPVGTTPLPPMLDDDEDDLIIPHCVINQEHDIPNPHHQIKDAPKAVDPTAQERVRKISATHKNPERLKRQLSRKISQEEDATKTAKAFLESSDIRPEEVMKLLEDEFGDLLQSRMLPAEDRILISELRKTIDRRSRSPLPPHHTYGKRSPNPIDSSAKLFEDSIENEKLGLIEDDEEDEDAISLPISETEILESEIPLPPLKNKVFDNVRSNEARRHSIDDLNSWFATTLDGDHSDDFSYRRKRENSLPAGVLVHNRPETPEIPYAAKSERFDSFRSTDDDEEIGHSSLLKYL